MHIDIAVLLQSFIQKYKGQTQVGNTPENKGQCVGLVSLWQDVLGVSHEYGNAKDLLANADSTKFTVVFNDPANTNQFPVPGDIMVLGASWGNGFGHTGIITYADGTSYDMFEQNDVTSADPNGACQILHHGNYNGVLGWLHFKQDIPQGTYVDKGTFDRLVTESTKYEEFVKIGYNDASVITTRLQGLQGQIDDLHKQLGDATKQNENLALEVKQTQDLLAKQADLTQQQATGSSASIDAGIEARTQVKELSMDMKSLAESLHVTYPPIANLTHAIQIKDNQITLLTATQATQVKTFQSYLQQFIKIFIQKKK